MHLLLLALCHPASGTFKLTGRQALYLVLERGFCDLSFDDAVPALYKSGNAQ